jgi:hypothetical protein
VCVCVCVCVSNMCFKYISQSIDEPGRPPVLTSVIAHSVTEIERQEEGGQTNREVNSGGPVRNSLSQVGSHREAGPQGAPRGPPRQGHATHTAAFPPQPVSCTAWFVLHHLKWDPGQVGDNAIRLQPQSLYHANPFAHSPLFKAVQLRHKHSLRGEEGGGERKCQNVLKVLLRPSYSRTVLALKNL